MKILVLFLNIIELFRSYKTSWVEDLPEEPKKNTIYIVGGREYPFNAVVPCPRKKCKKIIHLDIAPELKKRWSVKEYDNGSLSIEPSIHIISSPCRCHYWIRKGRVKWAELPSRVSLENKD